MTEPGAGFLSTAPLRAGAGERRRARVSLALLVLVVILCLLGPTPRDEATATLIDPTPLLLDGSRNGVGYYQAVADAFRFPEAERPTVWSVPLPAAILVRAALPDLATLALLWALSLATFMAWYVRLAGDRLWRKVAVVALLAGALTPFLLPSSGDRPEYWAALFAALALALRPETAWREAAALGLAAGVLSVAALPLLLGVTLAAAWQGYRRKAVAWAGALVVALAVLTFHLTAVLRVVPEASLLPRVEAGLGFGAIVAAAREASMLYLLPAGLAATLVAASLWAWGQVSDARVLATLMIFALTSMLVALPVGPILAVPLLAGLAFVPRALGRTVRVAVARERRITVRRVVR